MPMVAALIDSEPQLKRDLALSCRILAANGQGDNVYGHVSARLPGWDRCWMKPAWMGLEEVTEDDLILIDLDGRTLAGDRQRHSEYPIHTEVMRARPDVLSVVHTHPKFSIAFAAGGGSLRPISHEASLFWPPDVPTFEAFTELVRTLALERAADIQLLTASGSGAPKHTPPDEALRKRAQIWHPGAARSAFEYHARRLRT
jgi:L-fuculose-phosphate aldolase